MEKEKIFIKIDGVVYGFSNNKQGDKKIDYAIWGCSLKNAIEKFNEHYNTNNTRKFEFVFEKTTMGE
jgi:hypothetical protein